MKKNKQPIIQTDTPFNKESRENYFEMLKQAHRNLSIVDNLHQNISFKR